MQRFESENITARLFRWNNAEPGAWDSLLPDIYDELKRLARAQLLNKKLLVFQPTVLVHELYLHFRKQSNFHWKNRKHFFAVVALSMRRIVINEYVSKNSQKRGGGQYKIATLSDLPSSNELPYDLLDLDKALGKLEAVDPESCRIIELRYFAGLTVDEVAEVLELGKRNTYRKLAWAKAWLYMQLQ